MQRLKPRPLDARRADPRSADRGWVASHSEASIGIWLDNGSTGEASGVILPATREVGNDLFGIVIISVILAAQALPGHGRKMFAR
jgi:hypothetical protein